MSLGDIIVITITLIVITINCVIVIKHKQDNKRYELEMEKFKKELLELEDAEADIYSSELDRRIADIEAGKNIAAHELIEIDE